MNCAFCKNMIPEGKIMFRDECDQCGGDLHICLHCSFYDPHVSRQCREPAIADAPRDKDRKNLCEYFKSLAEGQGGAGESANDRVKQELEDLFK